MFSIRRRSEHPQSRYPAYDRRWSLAEADGAVSVVAGEQNKVSERPAIIWI
jgi:hypothetical protein